MTTPHTIVGAGITALMLAYHLRRAGQPVRLIARELPGSREQASYGNAGMLVFASYRPIAEPGLWRQGLSMLFNRDASLRIPLTYGPQITPWLLRLIRESSRQRADENALATLQLNSHSKHCWQQIVEDLNLHSHVKTTGWLKLFRHEANFRALESQLPWLNDVGLNWQTLNRDEVRDRVPELADVMPHGFMQSDSMQVLQPNAFVKALADQLQHMGVEMLQRTVHRLQKNERGFSLLTDAEPIFCECVSVCAGAWSQRLVADLGYRFPLETERGYHVKVQTDWSLTQPIMCVEDELVLSPQTEGLRITTGEELAGLDAPADYRLIERKVAKLQSHAALPSLNIADRWLGFRPSLPDSKPIIGQSPRHPGLSFAFGHGHLGMTQSAATGSLLAQEILGDTPSINLTPFRANRF